MKAACEELGEKKVTKIVINEKKPSLLIFSLINDQETFSNE